MTAIGRFFVRFGLFWYDFIVGDSITLAVGTLAALAVTYALAHGWDSTAAEVVLPVVIVGTLALALRKT